MDAPDDAGNCKEIFALLSEYLDLELPRNACEKIQAHLAGCPPCIEFIESLRRTVELFRQHRPPELPEPIGEQVRSELLGAYRKALAGR